MTRKTYRTPLGIVRGLGAATNGTSEGYHQRLTALALVPLSIGFVCIMLSLLSKDYNAVRADLGHPLTAIILLGFVLAGVYHMQIGLRSVILDYLHGHLREWTQIANILFCCALGLACIYAVARIGFV